MNVVIAAGFAFLAIVCGVSFAQTSDYDHVFIGAMCALSSFMYVRKSLREATGGT